MLRLQSTPVHVLGLFRRQRHLDIRPGSEEHLGRSRSWDMAAATYSEHSTLRQEQERLA